MKHKPFYDYDTEISAPASRIADCYMKLPGCGDFPINPDLITEKFFELRLKPTKSIFSSLGVISGIDATQSILFIDEDIYMDDDRQHIARQAIAHELGHIVYDSPQLRVNAPQTAAEAYAKHAEMKAESMIEVRANMFAGALLVPRRQLLVQAGDILSEGIKDIRDANPSMTVGTVFSALSGNKLTTRFGVSNDVIEWRLKNEKFLELLKLTENTLLSEVDLESITKLCAIESAKKSPSVPERVKRLLPQAVLTLIEA